MKGYRKIEMANFNCTFGDDNKPMLDYFMEIIYPAIISGIRKKTNGNEYFIEDVKLYEIDGLGFVITGLHIMKTELEVKSLYKEGKGIQATDFKYKSDPYSAFVIILKNHRMIYIKNQKGSPSIKSFGSSIRGIISKYTSVENEDRDKDNKLPYAFINISDIPSLQSIDQQFKEIDRIRKVTFRLYPLNGDMEMSGIFNGFRSELSIVGSKSGNININTPTNKSEISQLVKEAGDKVDTTLDTVLISGVEKKFKNSDFSEVIPVTLPEEEDDIHENIKFAINKVSGKEVLRTTSDENDKKYKSIYKKILHLVESNH